MIEIDRLTKSFGPRVLWSQVSLTVKPQSMLALIGPSGSGKSTLLNCLGLLDRPTSGTICHEGRDLTALRPGAVRRFRRDVLGYLFQNYALIENATVLENLKVALPSRRSRRRSASGCPTPDEALATVGLEGRGTEPVHRLSGGEQQRVALARLLVKQPALILADEPTGALDHDNAVMVVDTLRTLSDQGCAVVIATHNDYVRDRCDTVFTVGTTSEGNLLCPTPRSTTPTAPAESPTPAPAATGARSASPGRSASSSLPSPSSQS